MLEEHGFTNAFSTRIGGISAMPEGALNLAGFNEDTRENIHENRRRFLELFEGDKRLATVYQVHSADVRRFDSPHDAASDNDEVRGDALTIDARAMPNVLIAVKIADCVPVLIGDVRTGAAAAIHAGWRGTLARIVTRTIERMQRDFDSRPQDLIAAVGPAALACCYEVGNDVITMFENHLGERAAQLFTPTHHGHAHIDLHQANADELIAAGVAPENIYCAPFCTMHDNNLFFSYRREKILHGRVGRLIACIGRAT